MKRYSVEKIMIRILVIVFFCSTGLMKSTLMARSSLLFFIPSVGTISAGLGPAIFHKFSVEVAQISPTSPGYLKFGTKVKVRFKYQSRVPVYIFVRPLTKGKISPNYAAHASTLYPAGRGSGDGYFTINKEGCTVDGISIKMVDETQKNVLSEKKIVVQYYFSKTGALVGHVEREGTLEQKPLVAVVDREGTIEQKPLVAVVDREGTLEKPQTTNTQQATTSRPLKRFHLNFNDAYLVYSISDTLFQIVAQGNVLSYGNDWEKCRLKEDLFHIRQKNWKGFYWQVNTSRKEVIEVTDGHFCKISAGNRKKLAIKVELNNNRVILRFSNVQMVYQPSSKILQVFNGGTALSYGSDWQKCNLSGFVYQLKQINWKDFFWQVDTVKKKIWRVRDWPFSKKLPKKNIDKSKTPLDVGVEAIY